MNETESAANRKRKPYYSSRRIWSRTDTRTLLVFVNNRKAEFEHFTKKKLVHDHLAEDLTSSGISEIPFAPDEIRNKIKVLKSAYKTVIDSNNRTGAGPAIAPYLDLMDEIYRFENAAPESTDSLTQSVGIRQQGPRTQNLDDELFDSMIEVSVPREDEPLTPHSPADVPSTLGNPGRAPRRESEKEKLLKRKLDFQREAAELKEANKKTRMLEREEAKNKRHAEKRDWHTEKREWHKKLISAMSNRRE